MWGITELKFVLEDGKVVMSIIQYFFSYQTFF